MIVMNKLSEYTSIGCLSLKSFLHDSQPEVIASRWWSSGAGKGGKGGGCPPNVEKDGPRNSSKFDEKLGGGCVSASDVKKSLILNIFNVTVLFCTVFLLRCCYSELRNQRSTAFYCKNERNKPFSKSQIGYSAKYLFILTSAYEGGVGHVHSQSRGRGQKKFSGAQPQTPTFPPPQ